MSQQPAEIDTEYTWPPPPPQRRRRPLRSAHSQRADRRALNDLARRLARQSVNVLALSEETRRLGAEVAP